MRLIAVLLAVLLVSGDGAVSSTCEAPLPPPSQVALVDNSISISGPMDETMDVEFKLALSRVKPDKDGDVFVFIDSPGGNVGVGFDMGDAIEKNPANIVCVVTGRAASMAFYLLQSCDVRLAFEGTTLMTHEPFMVLGAPGLTRQQAREAANELDQLAAIMSEHISSRLLISRKTYDTIVDGHDWFMTPAEALVVGAIDGVVKKS